MVYGFTGTSQGMTPPQRAIVRSLLSSCSVLHHGDCVGSDMQAHTIAEVLRRYGQAIRIIGHPPMNAKLRAFCEVDEERPKLAYLVRNRNIVTAGIDGVIATPKDFVKPVSLRGQGTWTTIGYAQQALRRVWLVFPDGTVRDILPDMNSVLL